MRDADGFMAEILFPFNVEVRPTRGEDARVITVRLDVEGQMMKGGLLHHLIMVLAKEDKPEEAYEMMEEWAKMWLLHQMEIEEMPLTFAGFEKLLADGVQVKKVEEEPCQ